jgi:hypothetical protein
MLCTYFLFCESKETFINYYKETQNFKERSSYYPYHKYYTYSTNDYYSLKSFKKKEVSKNKPQKTPSMENPKKSFKTYKTHKGNDEHPISSNTKEVKLMPNNPLKGHCSYNGPHL